MYPQILRKTIERELHPDSFFDVSHVPFSTFGSWLSVRIPSGREDLFVRNHHRRNTNRNCFALIPILDGERVPVVLKTTPSKLEMAHEGGLVEVLWQDDHFVARLGVTGKAVESRSLIPHIPVILGQRLPMKVREHLRGHIESHLTEWGLSTEHIDSPCYKDDGY